MAVRSEDSELGRWTSAHWSPPHSSRLHGFVERIWYFEGTLSHARERVFPDGSAELIVMLDEPHRDGDADPHPAFPALCINGIRTRSSVVVAPPGRCRVLGVRFEPAGACLLLGGSMKELVDITVDLRDALGRAAEELGERCADAAQSSSSNSLRNAAAVLRAAVLWVSQRIDGDAAVDSLSVRSANVIRNARGLVSVDDLAATFGLTRSRFAQRFCDRIGVTPKRFARIVRFNAALRRLQEGDDIAEAAAGLAYYDQAHLHRDFSEFAGMTPGAFIAAKRFPGSPSVAEA